MISLVRRRPDKSLVIERPEYYVQTGAMFENPYGVPPDEIIRFILENPAEVVAQVVFGKYVESAGLVFQGELVQNLFDRTLPRILGNAWMDKRAAAQAALQFERFGRFNNRFHTGVDFARKTDYTVIFTIDTLTLPARVVYFKRLNRVPWDTIFAEVGRVVHIFGPNVLADATGPGGDSAMDQLEGRVYCPEHHRANLAGTGCMRNGERLSCKTNTYLPLSCVDPYHFTQTTKVELVEHLRAVLSVGYDPQDENGSFGWLRSPPIVQAEEEMVFYSWDDKKLVTDCLFSLALAAWLGLEDQVREVSIGSVHGS